MGVYNNFGRSCIEWEKREKRKILCYPCMHKAFLLYHQTASMKDISYKDKLDYHCLAATYFLTFLYLKRSRIPLCEKS